MQLPGPGVFGPPRDRDLALAVLRRAVELGVNHIDTAQYYGPDVANELIHTALHPYPDDLVFVSKVGADRDADGTWVPAQRPEQLRAGVEDNLRTLEVEQLGAVNLRLLDAGHEAEGEHVDLDSQLAEMIALRDEGKIGGIGISNVGLEQLQHAARQASPVSRTPTASSIAAPNRCSTCAARTTSRGCRTFRSAPRSRACRRSASIRLWSQPRDALGVTSAQVGLAWLLGHAPNILLIPGTSSLKHLAENIATGDVHLDAETMATLDAA